MNLSSRSYRQELLDSRDIPFEEIKRNMAELDVINTYLGGHAISIRGLAGFADKNQLSVCEIGCGGGDNLAAMKKWSDKKGIRLTATGIDIKKECIDVAISRKLGNTRWVTDDYRNIRFDIKPDVIFSSLFCHHFTDEQLVGQLKWMKHNCATGFFINDLQRHRLAYWLIRIITRLFSSSYLVKNDAPLSVARGFRRKEWEGLLRQAGIINYKIQWKWAFRYLIVFRHEA